MKNIISDTSASLGKVAWVLPTPSWPSFVLGSLPLKKTYTLVNSSQEPVTITGVGLVPGDDSRLRVGGLAKRRLLPQESMTLEVEASPTVLGTVKQVLCVEHTGLGSPLWIDIVFAVTREKTTREPPSYLADDTQSMYRRQREKEQDGHRRHGHVIARDHSQDDAPKIGIANEGGEQNNIAKHPYLDTQRFDGIDSNVNPAPPLNSEARTDFDNRQRDQANEKQLRLGNAPKMSTAPKPHQY